MLTLMRMRTSVRDHCRCGDHMANRPRFICSCPMSLVLLNDEIMRMDWVPITTVDQLTALLTPRALYPV